MNTPRNQSLVMKKWSLHRYIFLCDVSVFQNSNEDNKDHSEERVTIKHRLICTLWKNQIRLHMQSDQGLGCIHEEVLNPKQHITQRVKTIQNVIV